MAKAAEIEHDEDYEDEEPRSGGTGGVVLRNLKDRGDREVRDWLEALAGHSAMRVAIKRISPKAYEGHHCGGTLETVEEPIDEDYIRERWGGNKFQLVITRPNASGQYKYFGATTVEIAGPPKDDGRVLRPRGEDVSASGADSDTIAQKTMDMFERAADRERERAERAEERAQSAAHSHGLDREMLQIIQAPMRLQVEAMEKRYERLEESYRSLVGKEPPRDEFRDKMLDKMLDADNARITAIKTQHESELRVLKENHRAEMADQRKAHEREIQRMEAAHERELRLIERTYDTQAKVTEGAGDVKAGALRDQIKSLERELNKATTELAELRGKKDKSILEQAKDLDELREVLGGGSGGGDEKWYERIISAVGSSDAVLRLLGGADEGAGAQHQLPPAQQQPAAQQQIAPQEMTPPVGQPFQVPGDARIYVRTEDDRIVEYQPAAARRQKAAEVRQRQKAAAAGAPEAEGELPEGMAQPSPEHVALAVRFMENAVRNGTDPKVFAQGASSMVPQPILAYIMHVGVDAFLDSLARLDPGSPLTQQHGRNFAREVAKHLRGA